MASQDEIVDALAGMALFADLTTPQLKGVAHIFEEAWFPGGERILRQGLTGSAFYVILEGEAQILVDGQERATLGKGEFFGELSVIDQKPRNASIEAAEQTEVLALASWDLLALLETDPQLALNMIKGLAARLGLAVDELAGERQGH